MAGIMSKLPAELQQFESSSTRQDVFVAALLAALPLAALRGAARASTRDPSETQITLTPSIKFDSWTGLPPHTGEMATLYGGLNEPEPYLVLMKWNPAYFSAPNTYVTDRLSLVLLGTWWVNSGADFDPDSRSSAGRQLRPACLA
jgi:hypothetical protein